MDSPGSIPWYAHAYDAFYVGVAILLAILWWTRKKPNLGLLLGTVFFAIIFMMLGIGMGEPSYYHVKASACGSSIEGARREADRIAHALIPAGLGKRPVHAGFLQNGIFSGKPVPAVSVVHTGNRYCVTVNLSVERFAFDKLE